MGKQPAMSPIMVISVQDLELISTYEWRKKRYIRKIEKKYHLKLWQIFQRGNTGLQGYITSFGRERPGEIPLLCHDQP